MPTFETSTAAAAEAVSSASMSASRSRADSESGRQSRRHSRAGSSHHQHHHSEHRSSARSIPTSETQRYHRRSHSGINLARSPAALGRPFEESEASDTGAEADADEVPQQHLTQRRHRYLRTRSSSHLPLEALSGFTSITQSPSAHWLGVTSGGLWSGTTTPHPDFGLAQSSTGVGYFSTSPRLDHHPSAPMTPHDASPSDLRLPGSPLPFWSLRSSAAGAGVEHAARCNANIGVTDTSELSDIFPPPPPYEAADEAAENRRRAAEALLQLEHEQALAAAGSLLSPATQDDFDFLTFTAPNRHGLITDPSVATLSRSSAPGGAAADAVPPPSALSVEVTTSTDAPSSLNVTPTAASAPRDLPPAWEPKTDTENETDAADGSFNDRRVTRQPDHRRLNGTSSTSAARSRGRLRTPSSPLINRLVIEEEEQGDGFSPLLIRWLLHPLRMLAAVPGAVGTFWLIRNMAIHYGLSQSLYARGPLDPKDPASTNPHRLTCGLDFLLASLWALSTAYHALSLTTLLLRRWLVYYSLLPSLIRLLALQAICWPLVRLTIFVAGPDRPIEAWIVIASFTATSDAVARWVTSNIADAPTQRSGPKVASRLSSSAQGHVTTTAVSRPARPSRRLTHSRRGSDDASAVSGSSNAAPNDSEGVTSTSVSAPTQPTRKGAGRVKAGQRFWRAIMGAPLDSSTDSEDDEEDGPVDEGIMLDDDRLHTRALLRSFKPRSLTQRFAQRLRTLRGVAVLSRGQGKANDLTDVDDASVYDGTDVDGDGDGGETTDAGGITTTGMIGVDGEGEDEGDDQSAAETLRRLRAALRRRRRRRMQAKMAAISGPLAAGTAYASSSNNGAGYVRIRSRRIFHWEVAMKRNVAPIGVLAYLTLWGILLGGMSAPASANGLSSGSPE
ncbi:unnamed protein product [Parajaminaea phylloscopi]